MRSPASVVIALLLMFSLTLSPLVRVLGIANQKIKFEKIRHNKECFILAAESLLIPKSRISEIKNGEEIYYHNSKFDILEVTDKGDHWEVLAINDKVEKQLEEDGENRNGNDDSQRQKSKSVSMDWMHDFTFTLNTNPDYFQIIEINFDSDIRSGFQDELLRPPGARDQIQI